jgi:hypothetical protein
MELLPQADSMIRQLVPGVLDVAGLKEYAEELRGLDVLSCECGVFRACGMLQAIRVSEIPPDWTDVIEDTTFWAEAALWATTISDLELYRYCSAKIQTALETSFSSMNLQ